MITTELKGSNLKDFNRALRKELTNPEFKGFVKETSSLKYSDIKAYLINSVFSKLAGEFNLNKANALAVKTVGRLEEEGVLTQMIQTQSDGLGLFLWNWLPKREFKKQVLLAKAEWFEKRKELTVKKIENELFEACKSLYSGMAGALELKDIELDPSAFDDCKVWLAEMVKDNLIQP